MPEPLRPPLSASPDQLDGLAPRHPSTGQPQQIEELVGARAALASAYAAAEGVVALSEALSRDITLTPPARSLRLGTEAGRARVRAQRALTAAIEKLRADVEKADRDTSGPPPGSYSAATLAEIRQSLRQLRKPEDRRGAVLEALSAGDLSGIAAVADAPAIASALSPDERQNLISAYRTRFAQSSLQYTEVLRKGLATLERAQTALNAFWASATDATQIANAMAAVDRTAAAQAALNAG